MVGRFLECRNGVWHYRRRVPVDLAELDPRGKVRRTTRRRDYAEAVIVARTINAELEAYWKSLAGSSSAQTPRDFDGAVKMARAFGITYRPVADLARSELVEIVRRLELLETRNLALSPAAQTAALGGAPKPSWRLTDLYTRYDEISGDRLLGKSDDQCRKWRNPRKRAVANALKVIGDKTLADVTRDDALEFRRWWLDRVTDESMDPGTANKDLGHLAAMVDALNEAWRLKLDNPFSGLRLSGERHNPRPPFEPSFVRENFLGPGCLAFLNDEARAITQMVALTGARPAEIAALTEQRIALKSNIPHLQIRPDARELKSDNASRDLPLTGLALEIMRRYPAGFPRYRDVPDSYSAAANKALSEHDVRPTPEHTVYSLRHTFKDRLIALEAPERVQDALMGHAVREIKYGAGPSLQQRADWMAKVWA